MKLIFFVILLFYFVLSVMPENIVMSIRCAVISIYVLQSYRV